MERDIHPAETSLFVAAALRGYLLVDVPGGCYGVYKRNEEGLATVAACASYKDVANLCGATGTTTLRQAAERDGLLWPDSPEVLIATFKKL